MTAVKHRQNNKLRIIGGQWRGRKFDFHALPGVRPTSDRIRETLFNWLQVDVYGACCLDLFAGSGALGLEALSRGAGDVTFLDSARENIAQIKKNVSGLADQRAHFLCQVAKTFVATQDDAFDIIFLDPPFNQGLLQSTIDGLNGSRCLKNGTVVYFEMEKGLDLVLPENWVIRKTKKAGNVEYSLCDVAYSN